MRISCWKLTLLFGLSACSHASGNRHDAEADIHPQGLDGQAGQMASGDGGEVGGSSAEPACRTDKLTFSQETGCQNDNSVEFCLPANDTAAVARVQGIAPTVRCSQGGGGRAGCRPETEQLCQLPIPREQCPYGSSMPDALWRTVCQLAALDAVAAIVPTWYE